MQKNKRNPTVLLVEANIVVRHPLAEYLRECGLTVYEASNGEEAKILLNKVGLVIDIVLADMTTTGSGFPLRHWAIEHHPSVAVILAGSTEKAVNEAAEICKDGPALAKPYEHHLVLDRIQRLLAERDRNHKT